VSGVWHNGSAPCHTLGTDCVRSMAPSVSGVWHKPSASPRSPTDLADLPKNRGGFCVRCMAQPLGESAFGSRASEVGGGLTDTEPTEQGILPLFRYYTTFFRVCQYPPKKGKATDYSAAHDSVQPPAKSVAPVPFAHLPPIRLSALIPPFGESISLCLSVARPAHFIGSGSGGYYPLPIQQSQYTTLGTTCQVLDKSACRW
jgi:hypothetical protein